MAPGPGEGKLAGGMRVGLGNLKARDGGRWG